MSHFTEFLLAYGYGGIFVIIIARQACLPVPANLALIAAGTMARSGAQNPLGVIGVSVGAFLCADFAWYQMGRTLGSRAIHFMSRLSHDASSCEMSMLSKLNLVGWRTIVIAKFVIGLDSLTAPMAGIKGFTRWHFLLFDFIGATLWSSTYFAAGLLLSRQFVKVGSFAIVGLSIVFALLIARRLMRLGVVASGPLIDRAGKCGDRG